MNPPPGSVFAPGDLPLSGTIARIWCARARRSNTEAYLAHVTHHVFPTLRSIHGFRGGIVLQSDHVSPTAPDVPARIQIQVITFWESLDAVRRFAGADYARAVVEPDARAVLESYDDIVRHFDVRASVVAHE